MTPDPQLSARIFSSYVQCCSMLAPQVVLQLTFCYLSADEHLPGGPAVSAQSHLFLSDAKWGRL